VVSPVSSVTNCLIRVQAHTVAQKFVYGGIPLNYVPLAQENRKQRATIRM
jgi:hypothetical protein